MTVMRQWHRLRSETSFTDSEIAANVGVTGFVSTPRSGARHVFRVVLPPVKAASAGVRRPSRPTPKMITRDFVFTDPPRLAHCVRRPDPHRQPRCEHGAALPVVSRGILEGQIVIVPLFAGLRHRWRQRVTGLPRRHVQEDREIGPQLAASPLNVAAEECAAWAVCESVFTETTEPRIDSSPERCLELRPRPDPTAVRPRWNRQNNRQGGEICQSSTGACWYLYMWESALSTSANGLYGRTTNRAGGGCGRIVETEIEKRPNSREGGLNLCLRAPQRGREAWA